MTFTPLPDATQALITFLAAHASLSPLHGGRVSTRLQEPALPCLQVTALGGPQPWPWESAPEFQLASWGGTSDAGEGEAWALDLAVRAAVFDLLGTDITGGHVNGVAIRLAGLWSPADDTGRARVRSDISITVMP
ncbi:hypothetical protein ACFQS1_19710 [Paractinoplanes rhizophilus]|uniref:DUF3168 domain-containing protein n=1 Tax=Paractinoplanes rhizophilus TaxID=1416877 RepID=A0ABW2HUU9_9ACTN